MIVTEENYNGTVTLSKLPGGGTNVGHSFWGKLLRGIVSGALDIIESSGLIGALVGGELRGVLEDSGYLKEGDKYEPTPAEERIIVQWMDNKFKPFLGTLLNNLNRDIASGNIDIQLNGINKATEKMDIVTFHYLNLPTSGLSTAAINYRSNAIDELFIAVETVIEKVLNDSPTVFTLGNAQITPIKQEYLPLEIANKIYNCKKYSLTKSANVPPATPITLPATTQTNSIPPKNSTTSLPATVIINDGGENKIIFGTIVIGALLTWAFWPKDEKPEKRKPYQK